MLPEADDDAAQARDEFVRSYVKATFGQRVCRSDLIGDSESRTVISDCMRVREISRPPYPDFPWRQEIWNQVNQAAAHWSAHHYYSAKESAT
jgi:hypothetical protein